MLIHRAVDVRLTWHEHGTVCAGRPGLPEQGIGGLPAQLAARLPRVELGWQMQAVVSEGSRVSVRIGGETRRARAVVVATNPRSAAQLTAMPEPETYGLVTWWFEAPEAPSSRPLVAVDGRRSRPTRRVRSATPP